MLAIARFTKRLFTVLVVFAAMFEHLAVAGDSAWTPVASFGQPVTEFAFSYTDPGLIYFVGDGVFRSRDSGVTWEKVLSNLSSRILTHPNAPGKILAFGSALLESEDEGTSWTKLADKQLTAAAFHPLDATILYGLDRRGRFYSSRDAGRSWTHTSYGFNTRCCGTLAVDPANNIYVATVSGGSAVTILVSRDGGRSFAPLSRRNIITTAHPSIVVDSNQPLIIYISSETRILRTTDGGVTWVESGFKSAIPDHCDCDLGGLSLDMHSGDVYASVVPGFQHRADPFFIRSSDKGKTWQRLSLPVQIETSVVVPATFHPLVRDRVFTSTGEGILRSDNRAKSWFRFKSGLKGLSIVDLEAHATQVGRIYAVFKRALYKSNFGAKWEYIRPPGFELFRVDDFLIHPRNGNLWFALGSFQKGSQRGTFASSKDGGKTWQIGNPAVSAGEIVPQLNNENILYITNPLQKSTDQGRTWDRLVLPRGGRIIQLEVRPTGNQLFVIVNEGNRNSLLRSDNGGNTWREILAGRSQSVESVLFNRAGGAPYAYAILRVNNEHYLITGGIAGWKPTCNLPSAGRLQADPVHSNRIFISVSPGLYVSNDRGKHCGMFDMNGLEGYRRRNMRKVLIRPWGSNFYFALTQDGIFEYDRTIQGVEPNILSIFPPAAPNGEAVTIQGSGFGTDRSGTHVFFGSVEAGLAHQWSNNLVEVPIHENVHLAVSPVTIQNASGARTNSIDFVLQPLSGHMLPAKGTPGTYVTLKGKFSTLQNPRVLFGNARVPDFTEISDTAWLVQAPQGTGAVPVRVISDNSDPQDLGTFTYE